MPDDTTESWLPIVGYEGLYEVSDRGRVRSTAWGQGRRTDLVIGGHNHKGYRRVTLHVHRERRSFMVHALVLEAFVGPRPDGYYVDHKNTVKHDNRLANLEWVPPAVNAERAEAAGLIPHQRGEQHYAARLTEADVRTIRQLRAAGMRLVAIGARYGVAHSLISAIVLRKKWAHVA